MSKLVEFFRSKEEAWGLKGDYEDWSPERTAIELIRHLREEEGCPLCKAAGTRSTVHLDEKYAGEEFYLASFWCSNGHSWSERSKPWGKDQRAILRQLRAAEKAANV